MDESTNEAVLQHNASRKPPSVTVVALILTGVVALGLALAWIWATTYTSTFITGLAILRYAPFDLLVPLAWVHSIWAIVMMVGGAFYLIFVTVLLADLKYEIFLYTEETR